MDLIKYIIVLGLAASPVGEVIFAIMAGIMIGLNPGIVLLLSVIGNIIPIFVIIYLYELANTHPSLNKILSKIKTQKAQDFLNKYGAIGLIFVAPLIGVYSATLATITMGMDKNQVILAQIISVIIYALITTAFMLAGVKIFQFFHWIN